MNGILNIDKPTGWTSHDVVAWVRRVLRIKRVGHAGTLDPLATGVLLVCVGQATRVSEFLMAGAKSYRAQVRLGIVTDTYDTDGEVVSSQPVPELAEDDLRAAFAPFIGDIMQTPPAYSAIKQDGVPLHRRARRGEVVQPAPRPVRIHDITLVEFQPPHFTLDVSCDPGTYIRSLVHDLGQNLGCGAVMSGLRRTRSGSFSADDSQDLETIAEAARSGELSRYLHPISAALSSLTPVAVTPEAERQLRNGQAIPCLVEPVTPTGYAVAADGEVKAILAYNAANGTWRPDKVFAVDGDGERVISNE
jgi:tRNA pseudouridine55 synthase